MSIWHAIRREAAGAWRSLRYDLRRMRTSPGVESIDEERTNEEESGIVRGRVVFAGAAIMLLAVGVGGMWALVAGVEALLDPGAPPAGLPAHAGPAPTPEPSAAVQPVTVTSSSPTPTVVSPSPSRRKPAPTPSTRSSEPAPSPAPTCSCTHPPTPVPTAAPTPSATPTPTPTGEPTEPPTPTPAIWDHLRFNTRPWLT